MCDAGGRVGVERCGQGRYWLAASGSAIMEATLKRLLDPVIDEVYI